MGGDDGMLLDDGLFWPVDRGCAQVEAGLQEGDNLD